jgi:lipase maturation factor 1
MDALERLAAPFEWLVGTTGGASYAITRWVFVRGLGVVYLIAFVSLWIQVKGLIGSGGILPAAQYLDAVRGYVGPERFRLLPTVFWAQASDAALVAACAVGTIAAVLVIINVAPVPCLIVLWVLYLSLVNAGQDFFAFQWDALLLEAGFLAIFFAPAALLPGRGVGAPVPAIVLLLLWWLLFRLSFQSGLVKLTWGDSTWHDLTALDFHFYTQPLPTWTAWYAHQLPSVVKKSLVVVTFVLEIGAPLLMFGSRGMRLAACAGIVVMQLMILATGNYAFFNLLTIVLALLLIDDAAWAWLLPTGLMQGLAVSQVARGYVGPALRVLLAAFVLVVSGAKFWQNFAAGTSLPRLARRALAWVEPFRSINSYGLFRVMTTSRAEIIVEGSDDERTWQAYEFKDKPGDVLRRPEFVEPHQPRLDWQMWFAALEPGETTPWFSALAARLLQGQPDVLGLLARNPFQGHPPKYVRALLYDYRFTTAPERRATGAWWARALLGVYMPPASLGAEPAP